MKQKRAIVSVINDLVTDQRVARTCSVLHGLNYKIILVGRKLPNSGNVRERPYKCKRMRLFFTQGPAFYLFFNLRLFFFLLFHKSDLLIANDLDTLLPNFLISKIKGSKLIYDSHEIFCEVPELIANPGKKKIWERLEKTIVPKLKYCITINSSIANYFFTKYNVPFTYVRNIPDYADSELKSRAELGLPEDKKIIILQGAGINVQRGAEELVQAFLNLSNDFLLLIIGSGDVIPTLKNKVILQDQKNVLFLDKMPAVRLRHYTKNSDLGIAIDKDSNLNYHFSLPNKIFDYTHAGIPILASRLPEIEDMISRYKIGTFIENHNPEHIANQIREFINSEHYNVYKQNTVTAAKQNNWETEKLKLIALINAIQ